MNYAKPSTPYILILLFIFAVTAFDLMLLSKKNSSVIEISTTIEKESEVNELRPVITYTQSLNHIAP
ncbi:MAG: hypothetical protein ED557_05570 [Balneola sp.]|nr:MAG: hypothetical protein ED557_05570 [Balneola sp.]